MSHYQRKNSSVKSPEILFEDAAVVAVNKPAGILTLPDRWDQGKPNLRDWLRQEYPSSPIYVVHRLDAGTSGVILFAKTETAHQHLCRQFEQHTIRKVYLALVNGVVENNHGVIEIPLMPHPRKPGSMIAYTDGKYAMTHYKVLERFAGFSLLEIAPETGRMHQIRVHLQTVGHPLAVDDVYGGTRALFLSRIKRNYKEKHGKEEKPLIERLSLHAASIDFIHPDDGQEMKISSELPKDFQIVLKQLRKYQKN